jgi:hypothetical protein
MGNNRAQLSQAGQAGSGYLNILTMFGFQTGHYFLHQPFFLIC